jgi:SAM-dependent methyltransferase
VTDADRIYQARFPEADRARKAEVWRAVCEGYLQRFVREEDVVLDLGCGFGELLGAIRCRRRIGIDRRGAVRAMQAPGVEFHEGDVCDLPGVEDATVDVAFCSNLLEHLADKASVERLLSGLPAKLVPGGRLVVIGPNVRVAPGAYWDFWDHAVPLSERSLSEILRARGWEIEEQRARFLPLTTRGALPTHPWLVRLYLAVPLAWRVLGRQFLVVARRPRG